MNLVRHTRSSTFVAPQSKFPCGVWATKLDMTDLIDSNIDLFMYLIEGNKSGT